MTGAQILKIMELYSHRNANLSGLAILV